MKKTRIGINAFGIRRPTLRTAWGRPEFERVMANEVKGRAACAAHPLSFDSIQGRWTNEAGARDGAIDAGGRNRRPNDSPCPRIQR
jgi:glyceraldehyde 3-phosphate dehydrogenase